MADVVGSQKRAWLAGGVCAFKDRRLLWTSHLSYHDINTGILAEGGEFVKKEICKVQ